MSWLVGRDNLPVVGLPGLRVETSYEEGWRLRHLPTGAALAVTGDRHGRLRGRPDPDSNWLGLWGTDVPVSEEEYATLEALPRLSEEAETLLAALTVRLCAHGPAEAWDIGMWFYDLSERPQRGYAHHRRLFAEGDRCALHRDSTPHPEDLRAALTHPVVGLPGATSHPMPTGWNLRYGQASLTAHPHAYQA